MHLDQAMRERQADADAARRVVARGGGLREGLEDAIEHVGGDPDAGVAHAHRHPALGGPHRHVDPASGLAVFRARC